MDRINVGISQNERTLWHGTSNDAIQNINANGFNRSYCGKNGKYILAIGQLLWIYKSVFYSTYIAFMTVIAFIKFLDQTLLGHAYLWKEHFQIVARWLITSEYNL